MSMGPHTPQVKRCGTIPGIDGVGPFVGLFAALGDPGGASIEFAAHYAGYDQELGWYNPTDPTDNGLLLVIGSGVSNQTPSFEVVGDFIPSTFFGLYDTVNGDSQTWYSEASENSDGYTHFAIFSTPVVNQYFIGVEDLSLGDQDYNDLVFSLTINPDGPGTNTPEVPEPATICMMLMGGGALLVRRKKMV
jgi:hypothetical protein